jgi:hypothetical protein
MGQEAGKGGKEEDEAKEEGKDGKEKPERNSTFAIHQVTVCR